MSTDTERFRSNYRRPELGSATSRLRGNFDGDSNKSESKVSSGVSRFSRDKDLSERFSKAQISSNKKHEDNDDHSDKDENDTEETTTSTKRSGARGKAAGAAGKKRKEKRNLREKRRSTGVVMLGQSVATDEEEKKVMENTAKNAQADAATNDNEASGPTASESMDEKETLLRKIDDYEKLVEEWKDETAKLKKENEKLLRDNQRLKDENAALLRVVGNLSAGGRK